GDGRPPRTTRPRPSLLPVLRCRVRLARWLHDIGRRTGPERARSDCLEAVGLAAAAAGLHVRILDREAGAHHVVLDEVDLAALEIRHAVLVDVDLDAVLFDDVVTGGFLVFPAQLVRHSGAAAADDANAETPLGLAFFQAEIRNLLGGHLCQCNHANLLRFFAPCDSLDPITGCRPRAGA